MIDGAKLLNEALDKGVVISDLLVSDQFLKAGLKDLHQEKIGNLWCVPERLFKQVATTTSPSGVLAIAAMQSHSLSHCLKREKTLIVVLDSVQDPGNLGTIIRTSYAFGASGVVLLPGCVDHYNPKVVRSAMGASFALPIVTDRGQEEVIAFLRKNEVQSIALDPRAGEHFDQLNVKGPLAFFFGNEGHGFAGDTLALVDHTVRIAMINEAESLNVAISAAIVLFHCAKVR